MKELLEKFLGVFSEGVEKMEENNQEEAVKKFKEASSMTNELKKKASENVSDDNLTKFFKSEAGKKLLEEGISEIEKKVKELTDSNETLTKKVEDLEKQKESDDELISKTIDNAIDRVEEIEKTLDSGVSKIS